MEFDLIHRHFKTPFGPLARANADTVLLGIGDDCAALQISPGQNLFTSTDTLGREVSAKENTNEDVGALAYFVRSPYT